MWWYARVCRAELLRACCARWLERRASTEASCWNDGVRWTERGCSISAAFVDRASEGSAMMSATGAIPGRMSMGGQTRTIPRMCDRFGFAECRSSR